MRKLSLLLFGVIVTTIMFKSNPAKAYEGTYGKACPDINSDMCCETGRGGCLETVVIVVKRKK